MITKFSGGGLVLIEDFDTIERAKEQRKKSEWILFSEYVKDSKLRILFQMGLTLRSLEKEGLKSQLKNLRTKVLDTHGKNGLHVAYFVQNGLFSKYFGNVLERISNPKSLKREILSLFENIDKTVAFITKYDDIIQKSDEITSKIYSNNPNTFILSSYRSIAMKKCKKIKKIVMTKISNNYECEIHSLPKEGMQEIYFLNRKQEDGI